MPSVYLSPPLPRNEVNAAIVTIIIILVIIIIIIINTKRNIPGGLSFAITLLHCTYSINKRVEQD